MNHAERKALKRAEKKEPEYRLTAKQIDEIRQKAVQEAYDRYIQELGNIDKLKMDSTMDALKMLVSVPVVILSDKFGFDEDDLNRFLDYMKTWVIATNQDENTIQELVDEAKQLCNFEIEFA